MGFGFNLSSSTAELPFGLMHFVSGVDPGGAAEQAGLAVGQRVIEVEDCPVKDLSHPELIKAIKTYTATGKPLRFLVGPPNESIKLTLQVRAPDPWAPDT